jgi:molybdate transport system substrate-binding protein
MKVLFLIFFLFGVWLDAGLVRVALAANVSYAMPDLIRSFHIIHPDIKVDTTIGGSGKLHTQILRGAPYDLFLSADMGYPGALYEANMTMAAPVVYAQGALVILSDKNRDFSRGIKSLLSPSVRRIAIANPHTAPYGKAAFEALAKAGLIDIVRSKFVYGESISQTVSYTQHGADVGLVAKSALYAPQMHHYKQGTNWVDVDTALYHPIDQGMVVLKSAADPDAAKKFYHFLLSDKARTIFSRYGYHLP